MRKFCPTVPLDNVVVLALLIELLGVDPTKATELRQCRDGPVFRIRNMIDDATPLPSRFSKFDGYDF